MTAAEVPAVSGVPVSDADVEAFTAGFSTALGSWGDAARAGLVAAVGVRDRRVAAQALRDAARALVATKATGHRTCDYHAAMQLRERADELEGGTGQEGHQT